MIQFYSPDIENTFSLGPEESSHCVRVLRKREGDIIFVTDGKGKRFTCRLTNSDCRKAELEIISKDLVKKSWNYTVTLILAPTKNADRMAWLVEKATEIGVDRILFVTTRYTERSRVNIERLRRNAVSAMNQSLKARLPEIDERGKIDSILDLKGEKYFGYCDEETPRAVFVKELKLQSDTVIAIGPEGDFSKDEVKNLINAGYRPVTFGNERLRTETAALYAVTAVHALNNYAET